jgi:hypothetical protein
MIAMVPGVRPARGAAKILVLEHGRMLEEMISATF